MLLVSVCAISHAYENEIYIWQRDWRPELSASVERIAQTGNGFKVLTGDLRAENERIGFSKAPVTWEYLVHKGKVTVDVRMRTGLARFFAREDTSAIAAYLARNVDAVIEEAKAAGVDIAGVELDYDCPSGKIKDFARFIRTIRPHLKGRPLSVTALPSWLDSPDCQDLFNAADQYVLQLHSFEPPKNGDSRHYIFPDDKALGYFKRAVSFRRPFYVSLPTYGYEVAYGKDDEFVGLRAESGVQYYGEGIKRSMVFSDPAAIVKFLDAVSRVPSEHFAGVCWFRLPVASDRFNWDMAAFERVMKRETPQGHLRVETARKPGGPQELFLVNDGELNFSDDVNFDIIWKGDRPLYDVLSGFDHTDLPGGNGVRVTGRAPRVGHRKMIGWFRTAGDGAISNSEVRYHEEQ